MVLSRHITHGTVLVGVLMAGLALPSQFVATERQTNPAIVGREQRQAIQNSLVGVWVAQIGQIRKTMEIRADGGFSIGDEQGSYRTEGNTLILLTDADEVAYEFSLEDGRLTLSGGDLVRPVEFAKLRRFGGPGTWFSNWSPPAVTASLRRIMVIVLIVALATVMVWLSKAIMHFVIYSQWGPLKLVYRYHKRRTVTVYALVLNIAKYIIYLVALGLVLTELGIDYTVYFASLSVIGLAIGFGSQGLVQDMVTGFFIVFEEQFNVGDMVEIPPHTGIVEDLGLRMTRLRNYVGQRVVIPNRNIAAVGNYLRGAQQVYLDVALSAEGDVERAATAIKKAAEETARQFHDVILADPESQGEIVLSTGERFVRLHLAIWPQQQWIIDQELLPRIRGTMDKSGTEIPGDKISVFYHPREQQALRLRRQRQNSDATSS